MGDNGGPKVLIVEDDERVTAFLKQALGNEGFAVEVFPRAEDALARVRTGGAYQAALVDVLLSGMDGLAFTRAACSLLPDMFVIVMTGYGTGELAAQAIRVGAYDYLPKPFDAERVLKVLRAALRDRGERLRNISMAYAPLDADVLLGDSAAMREIFKAIGRLAGSKSNVVIRGEPGSGRSLVARAIHRFSQNGRGPYVTMDCGAYDREAAAIILFGGGSDEMPGGRLSQAAGGTLVLRRPDLLHESLQTRLLGLLSEGESAQAIRIITILPQPGQEITLLPELFYKLRVVEIDIPPLRERKEDIPVLTDYFRRLFNYRLSKSVPYFTQETMAALMNYNWPGNVRDLKNAVEYAMTKSQEQIPRLDDFPPELAAAGEAAKAARPMHPCVAAMQEMLNEAVASGRRRPLDAVISKARRMIAKHALDMKNGNITDAAKLLGISKQALRRLV
jgi:two-component system nitrogen regulation response regulator GlnG